MLWSLTGRLSALVLGLAISVMLARLLAPADLGLYFLAVSVAGFLATGAQLGLGQVVVRLVGAARGNGRPDDAADAVRTAARLGVPTALAIGVLSALVLGPLVFAAVFALPLELPVAILLGAVVSATAVESLVSQTWRAYEDIPRAVVFGGLASRLGVAAGLGAILVTARTVGVATALAVLLGATVAPLLVAVPRLSVSIGGWRGGSNRQGPATLAGMAAPFLGISLLTAVNTHIDLWVVGTSLAPDAVAVYANAAKVALLLGTPLVIANGVLPPMIARLHGTGRTAELERVLRAASTVAAVPTLLGLGIVATLGRPLLSVLFGPVFGAGATVLLLLGASQLAFVATGPCGFVLMMSGHERPVLAIGLGTTVAFALGAPIAALTWGIEGVAAVRMLTIIFSNVVMLVVGKRRAGVWAGAYLVPTRRRLQPLFSGDASRHAR